MMTSLLNFSLGFITMVVGTLSFSIKGNHISRTFYEMPPDVIAISVQHVGYYGEYKTCFNKSLLESTVNDYLKLNLKNVISSYKIGFTYLKLNNGEFIKSWDSDPQYVDIQFNCKYNQIFKFEGFIHFKAEGIYQDEWKDN